MSSTPLYDLIVVDRKRKQVIGFTFEQLTDQTYSERYIFQAQTNDNAEGMQQFTIKYDMDLFKSPGFSWPVRVRLNNWGHSAL